MEAEVLVQCKNTLGESPMWNAARGSFIWVDIDGQMLYEYHLQTKIMNKWKQHQKVSLVLESNATEVILAFAEGLGKLNLTTKTLTWLLDIEKDKTENRTNDGAVDGLGRIWLGTMALNCTPNAGAVYCIEKDLRLNIKIPETTIANGIVWNADNTKMYFIDSASYTVKSYHFDLASGNINFEKEAVRISPDLGMPDGMAMDAEGMLWVAVWGGNGVYRYNPENGMLLDTVHVDAPNVTSCAFGGEQLDQLIITTATVGLSPEEAMNYPESGNVFIVKTKVKGMKMNRHGLV